MGDWWIAVILPWYLNDHASGDSPFEKWFEILMDQTHMKEIIIHESSGFERVLIKKSLDILINYSQKIHSKTIHLLILISEQFCRKNR